MKFYEVDNDYINYLSEYEPRLFHNKKPLQIQERKFIGIVLEVNGFKYFAPLSSFKNKHRNINKQIDCIKIAELAVINLNNMFPIPEGLYTYIDFSEINDIKYRNLLFKEYNIIKDLQDKISKNAKAIYAHKLINKDITPLAKRCNDFLKLEDLSLEYILACQKA